MGRLECTRETLLKRKKIYRGDGSIYEEITLNVSSICKNDKMDEDTGVGE